jgi:hypothetical protein
MGVLYVRIPDDVHNILRKRAHENSTTLSLLVNNILAVHTLEDRTIEAMQVFVDVARRNPEVLVALSAAIQVPALLAEIRRTV